MAPSRSVQSRLATTCARGDPVATFVDNTSLIVTGSIAEQDAGFVRVGENATAVLVTGQEVKGRIRYLAPVAEESTRTFTVELEIPNPGGKLPAGVTTEMRISGGEVLAYRIAPSLLTLDANGELGIKTVGRAEPGRIPQGADCPLGSQWRVGYRVARDRQYHCGGPGLRFSRSAGAGRGGPARNGACCRDGRWQDGQPRHGPCGCGALMNALIDLCVSRSRAVMVALAVLLFAGATAYRGLPKEAQPDVDFPFISVEVMLDGVAAEDSERLLVRPLEQQLRNLEGLKEMVASATENRASVTLEFGPEVNVDKALTDVRERVDQAKAELPDDAREPTINEVKFSRFDPMLVINLGGNVPERAMNAVATDLQDRLQAIDGVLEVNMVGIRKEILEIVVNPLNLESYGLSLPTS